MPKPRFECDLSGREQREVTHTVATGSRETLTQTWSALPLVAGNSPARNKKIVGRGTA